MSLAVSLAQAGCLPAGCVQRKGVSLTASRERASHSNGKAKPGIPQQASRIPGAPWESRGSTPPLREVFLLTVPL
ncbi:unnamed protein product [Closterium sp. NIES-54]